MLDWNTIKEQAREIVSDFANEYAEHLEFEIKEIEKQGAEGHWVDIVNSTKIYQTNDNGLVLPLLHEKTTIDPIKENIPHNIEYQPDYPDIDIDFMPRARDPVKQWISSEYGDTHVCSVGLWQTFKPKSALQDACKALDMRQHLNEVINLTKSLPDEFDDMDLKQAMTDFKDFRDFADLYPDMVKIAYKMVGCIRAQGKHAGGVIISSVPIHEYIPLSYIGSAGQKHWTAEWTEGMRSTHLSKFGFVKFDILGLINVAYIHQAGVFIEQNRAKIIDWKDMSPEENRAGWITDKETGELTAIEMNDAKALAVANDAQTASVFQFNTHFQRSILSQGGVKSFDDLVAYNALGRPGPMEMISTYVARRDGEESWRDKMHKDIADILQKTYGVICFQEQLQEVWTKMAGLTIPEAEKARKSVAKKKQADLLKLGPKVIAGLSRHISKEEAEQMWESMKAFGRYAFNLSHSLAYAIISYRCLWLKTYFPTEWWAAVLTNTEDSKKLGELVETAKTEGVEFGDLHCDSLTKDFTVRGDHITPGLKSIKKIGAAMAEKFAGTGANFSTVEEFIQERGKSKVIMERLVKLGAFQHLLPNRKALWLAFQYLNRDKETKKKINKFFEWTELQVERERKRQTKEYFRAYPNRKKLPKKIENWKHVVRLSFQEVYDFVDENDVKEKTFNDFSMDDILKFEKEFLGYYWRNPMKNFENKGKTIKVAKKEGVLECIVQDIQVKRTKNDSTYFDIRVTDGMAAARVIIWSSEILRTGNEVFKRTMGIRLPVSWNSRYKSFTMKRDGVVELLKKSGQAYAAEG